MTGGHYEHYTRHGSADRDWMRNALCRINGTPQQIREHADMFFPKPNDRRGRARAEAICDNCPVQQACDEHRRALDIQHGVWGGYHVDQPKPCGPAPRCGTERAYNRHIQLGQPVDPACLAAGQNAWQRRRKNHQKTKGQK